MLSNKPPPQGATIMRGPLWALPRSTRLCPAVLLDLFSLSFPPPGETSPAPAPFPSQCPSLSSPPHTSHG